MHFAGKARRCAKRRDAARQRTAARNRAVPLVAMDVCNCWAAGDLDLSGAVRLQDLALLLSAFGLDSRGDLNGDTLTSLADLAILLANFGEDCP
jgi:hypothetical protein